MTSFGVCTMLFVLVLGFVRAGFSHQTMCRPIGESNHSVTATVLDYALAKKKPSRQIGVRSAACGIFLVGILVFAAAALPRKQAETVQTQNTAVHEEASHSETTVSVITETAAQTSTTTSATKPERTETTENTTETTGEIITEETTTVSETEYRTEAPEQSVPAEIPETVPAETEPPAPVRMYRDGTFTATAYGYDGNITVHVTIQNDTITDITAETEESDDSFFFDAKNAVIPAIIRSQTADADACSGATYSSNGIMTAVRTALEQARI